MNKFILKLVALVTLVFPSVRPGVIISIDVLNEVAEGVRKQQQAVSNTIQNINNLHNSSFQFDKAPYLPHLSLAFVSQEPLSIQDTETKFPDLKEKLIAIASQFSPVDIGGIYKNLTFDYFQGKFKMPCGGSPKENYINLVLKGQSNPIIEKLSTAIRTMLETEYNIKQAFPLSVHLTLGRIYLKDDQSFALSEEFKKELEANGPINIQEYDSFIVKEFKLNGHDKSALSFSLNQN